MKTCRIGVVIPAWNEAAHLPALLSSLCEQTGVALDAVVVANGCTDGTAVLARGFADAFSDCGHVLRVLEIPEASKAAALRAGDAVVSTLPKAYVDADVILSPSALAAVATALDVSTPLVCAPRLRFAAPSGTARLAAFLEATPPFSDDVVGGGFYALNETARARFGAFPDLVADDAFVLGHFARHERSVVHGAEFLARFPDRPFLPPVLARWEFGRRQAAVFSDVALERRRVAGVLLTLGRPKHWRVALLWWRLKRQARRAAIRQSTELRVWARADGLP